MLNLPNQSSLSRHPSDGYFFFSALRYRYQHKTFSRPIVEWTNEEHDGMSNTLQSGLSAWKQWMEDAESAGNGTFTKEHINFMLRPESESDFLYPGRALEKETGGNPTCIPDGIFGKVQPTFLIRHPALVVPSLVRTALDLEGTEAVSTLFSENSMRCEGSYRWHVALYKYLEEWPAYQSSSYEPETTLPIILDAADLSNPALVQKYAAAIGLDPKLVQSQWKRTGDEGLGKVEARMKDTILMSEGLMMDKLVLHERFDLEEQAKVWEGEFGAILGNRVARLVKDAMADYEWLHERRIGI
jgi:hypothetical protein